MENLFLNLVFGLLLILIAINLFRFWQESPLLTNASFTVMWLVVMALLAILAIRIWASGRLPFANLYEFSLLLCLGIMVFSLSGRGKPAFTHLHLPVGVLTLIIVAVSGYLPSELRPLMPALQSPWLYAHVATAVLAYGCFALACCLGIILLLKSPSWEINQAETDESIYKWVVVGFILLSVVIITGAVWAEEVWGRWWSWDPKETWSLITWLVYAAHLHARRTYGWKGRKSAWMVVIGFIIVMFTLFGVSVLLPGLHSYL
jgi:ABC-type transport system involved in cytochrome c biogenesis permease subunit